MKHLNSANAAALAAFLSLSGSGVAAAQSSGTAAPKPPAAAAAAPLPAKALVDSALADAKANQKAVLVVFHASWCSWCHRLDKVLLEDPKLGPLLANHYKVVHIDVAENGEKKVLENPGGDSLQADWGGKTSGLPFYVFLDSEGKKLADSNVMGDKKTNIGYPGAPDEIVAFMDLLKKTAPRLSDDESDKIIAALKKNAP